MTAALADLEAPSLPFVSAGSTGPSLRPAPHREPPFDDELALAATAGPHDRALPLEWHRTAALRTHQRQLTPLRAVQPDPATWARRLLIGIVESAAGKRPLHQVAALLSPGVRSGLSADFDKAARVGCPHWLGGALVRSMRVSEPADGVAELSATVGTGRRVRAVAMRLEVRHGRWCCTRLVLG